MLPAHLDNGPCVIRQRYRINNQRILVHPVSVQAMATLIQRFPELRQIANGKDGTDLVTQLVIGCGKAVGPIIAASCGYLGDEDREMAAANLPPDDQLELLEAIFSVTFPNGIGSFVARLTNLMGAGNVERAKVWKVRLKKSPSTSPASSDTPDSLPATQ